MYSAGTDGGQPSRNKCPRLFLLRSSPAPAPVSLWVCVHGDPSGRHSGDVVHSGHIIIGKDLTAALELPKVIRAVKAEGTQAGLPPF